jgi:protein phosphatase
MLTIPALSLVVLIGPSGSGKSTFARRHFKPTEVLSSDTCRALVSDDETDQAATPDAFAILHFIAAKRLAAGRLTVVDATNVRAEDRKPLLALAREYHCLPVAIVFDLPEALCQVHNRARSDRDFGPHVVRNQLRELKRGLRGLKREGFRHLYTFTSPEEVNAAELRRVPLWTDRRDEHGPFDIIGDVHGCFDELVELLTALGYTLHRRPGATLAETTYTVSHPEDRRAVFLGDLVDRGPKTPEVLRLVMDMVAAGSALCVPGNHDIKLQRKLQGRDVHLTHGLAESLAQLAQAPPTFQQQVIDFIDSLVSHSVLDEGRLVVAHAGMPATMQGRASGRVREFALYGETTGETDEYGLPVRYPWAADYRGKALVVYGHTPVPEPEWLNRTLCLDTGCVFGGRLTALRYPERELVSVPARYVYYQPSKPFLPTEQEPPVFSAQQTHDELLDIEEVLGKRQITTRWRQTVTIPATNAAAALEVLSRFAANPKWLIYLPPTMSPSETSREEGLLEHPREAFAYYRHQGVARVVGEEKHMGSRAVVIVCRDEEAARHRFGVLGEGIGICYTRTGRRFFTDPALEALLLKRLQDTLDRAGFWNEFSTTWVCLDAELLPWSAKAQALLRQQYAAVGASSRVALNAALTALEQTQARGIEVAALLDHCRACANRARQYVAAYRRYCWPVNGIADFKLAPFHLLATEGRVHVDKPHLWHLETLNRLCASDQALLLPTAYRTVDLTDAESEQAAVEWWLALTEQGGEGIVIKPWDFLSQGRRGGVQPALKCRGREYLRIIYGPEYTAPEHLVRLRTRGLAAKRALARQEFALGLEALERFTRGEPLRRVHECVAGVLALESEPVDPRL